MRAARDQVPQILLLLDHLRVVRDLQQQLVGQVECGEGAFDVALLPEDPRGFAGFQRFGDERRRSGSRLSIRRLSVSATPGRVRGFRFTSRKQAVFARIECRPRGTSARIAHRVRRLGRLPNGRTARKPEHRNQHGQDGERSPVSFHAQRRGPPHPDRSLTHRTTISSAAPDLTAMSGPSFGQSPPQSRELAGDTTPRRSAVEGSSRCTSRRPTEPSSEAPRDPRIRPACAPSIPRVTIPRALEASRRCSGDVGGK